MSLASQSRDTGYGSPLFPRAARAAMACSKIEGSGLRALLRLVMAGFPLVLWYRWRLPRLEVTPGEGPAGQMIREHLMFRRAGRLKFRHAQGVLFLPPTFAEYKRGRHRQAVRTNVGHAHKSGMSVQRSVIEEWAPGPLDCRYGQLTAGPVERWTVLDAEGQMVGDAILTVAGSTALLQGLMASANYARWLLHTAIVERLCGTSTLLLTNSDDVLLMKEGNLHFQRLLGYTVVRIHLHRPLRATLQEPAVRLAALCLAGASAIVASHITPSVLPSIGERALVWLTALVTVRIASGRAGPAAVAGGLAALGVSAIRGLNHPMIPLTYFLAGLILDAQLALLPRLTWNIYGVALAGMTVMFTTAVAPGFPTVGHHLAHHPWAVPPVLAAVLFGAGAAALGWCAGKVLLPVTRAQLARSRC